MVIEFSTIIDLTVTPSGSGSRVKLLDVDQSKLPNASMGEKEAAKFMASFPRTVSFVIKFPNDTSKKYYINWESFSQVGPYDPEFFFTVTHISTSTQYFIEFGRMDWYNPS